MHQLRHVLPTCCHGWQGSQGQSEVRCDMQPAVRTCMFWRASASIAAISACASTCCCGGSVTMKSRMSPSWGVGWTWRVGGCMEGYLSTPRQSPCLIKPAWPHPNAGT